MDRAVERREVIVVRRPMGGDVALIAADELASLVETAHLMRSPRNAQRLLAALSRARSASGPEPALLRQVSQAVPLHTPFAAIPGSRPAPPGRKASGSSTDC